MKNLAIWTLLLFIVSLSQTAAAKGKKSGWTLGADLFQPIITGGWNLNAYYNFSNNFILAYSHGDNLKFNSDDPWANKEMKKQDASTFVDYSTGFELGYRTSKKTDVRVDFKIHKYDIDFKDGQSVSYRTGTIGPSVYYHWFPVNDHFIVALSARYWFFVGHDGPENLMVQNENNEVHRHDVESFSEGTSGPGLNISFAWKL